MGPKRKATADGYHSKKSKKQYYTPNVDVKGTKCGELRSGLRGALLTCDTHLERKAIKETYALFESFVDAADAPTTTTTAASSAGGALAAELAALQEAAPAAASPPLFTVAQTGCPGTVMVQFAERAPDPVGLVDRVMAEALASQSTRAPHVVRLLPVQATCAAKIPSIVQAARPLLAAAMAGSDGTYAVHWKRRFNNALEKMEVIDALATVVNEIAPKARVALAAPDAAVMVEVVKNVCCISVLPAWRKFGQYNLRALAAAAAPAAAPAAAAPAAAAAAAPASIAEKALAVTQSQPAGQPPPSPAPSPPPEDAPSRPSSVFRLVRGSEASEGGTVEGDLREEATRAAKFYRGVPGLDGAYLHCSSSDQVAGTVERYFVGVADLLLCRFSVAQLVAAGADVRWEEAAPPDGSEPRAGDFPHVYGAPSGLPYAALEGWAAIPLGADGKHAMPDELLRM